VANGAGLQASALITDMDQPLASCAGNAVEVLNAIHFLTGEARDARLEAVTLALAGEMLVAAGLTADTGEGERRARAALESGEAAERFGRMVAALGGPADLLERANHYLPLAPVERPVSAEHGGIVEAIDTRALGLAVVAMKGGRLKPDDGIDFAVGLSRFLPLGAEIRPGDALALVHARSEAQTDAAVQAVRQAYRIGQTRLEPMNPVIRRVASRV